MKFYYSLYELQPRKLPGAKPKDPPQPPRKGALLKVEWSEDKIGYADLHPWPEFGDMELEDHLAQLRQMRLTTPVEQAIWLASLDAKGRQEKKNIYENQNLLKNNGLLLRINPHTVEILDPLVKAGFSKVKVKVGFELEEEVEMINRAALTHEVKIRMDFNSRLTWTTFEKYMTKLSPNAKRQIEYIEDPFPYDPEMWKEARQIIPLAIDWELKKIPLNHPTSVEADIIVLKPTHDDVDARVEQSLKWNKKITVTSHMGHPLGVMQCAAVAQDLAKKHPNMMLDPGCLSFDVYEPNEFTSLLNVQGPYIKKVGGWGIGFDFLLRNEKWNLLKTL
jgi:O-succinylbenzoate synthase